MPEKPKPATTKNGTPLYGKDSHFKGKGGNNVRHGMHGSKLPKGCEYVEQRVNILRRTIEAAILEAKGEINIVDAAAINSILKWERHGLLANHWLKKNIDTLSASELLKFSEATAKASDARDKNIRQLGLDRDRQDTLMDQLYARVVPAKALPAAETEGTE